MRAWLERRRYLRRVGKKFGFGSRAYRRALAGSHSYQV